MAKGCLRVFLGGILLLLTVIVAGVAVVVYQFHRATTAPDVRTVARSAAVDAADAETVRLLDDRTATVTALAVDMTPVATAVRDRCGSAREGIGFGAVTCTRTVSLYFAYGGRDVTPRRAGWDTALRHTGWTSSAPTPDPYGWRTPVSYSDAAGVTLGVVWVTRPEPPTLWESEDFATTYDRVSVPVDAAAAAATAYRTSSFMAMAVLRMPYYNDKVRPTPSPQPDNYHPCFSGSGTCVGG
jgi:hypothetical protein